MAICEAISDCSSWVPTRAQSGSGQGYRKDNSCAQFHFHQCTHQTWWWRCSLALSSPSRKHLQPQQRMVTRVDKKNFISNLRALVGDTKCVRGASPDLHLPRAAGAFVSGGVGESDVKTRNLLILWNCMVTDGGIMVWGGIWHNDRTDLVVINGNLTGLRYRDEILVQHVLSYAGAVGDASC